ncbi:MAG TPA: DUF883 domain-containing protein [Verrucomicrobiae bacterium]|jgi:ElaB/YqjD/DUF883 family membrane-anchored ribosome-binding protein|nr:DUF883 domain-containing protein [Verrucomicrobiae bacterium]
MNEINRIGDNLTDDTRALIDAAAQAAEEKVEQTHDQVVSVLESARKTYDTMQKQAIQSAKAADKLVRENPYRAAGIAFGVGALVGFLLSRRGE